MAKSKPRNAALMLGMSGLIALPLLTASPAQARPRLPEIRLSATNQVPVCVTPERLMKFMHSRNKNRKIRRLYKDIAFYFKKHGERLKVRWDYAFFQSMIETNFLTYRAGNGRWGDVALKQYNFAGIGTTGGGVPGNGFKDVSTGVMAQLQHLIAYSGEYQKNPTAPRTALKQDVIIRLSKKLRRPVRFDDLAGRWAVDRNYANSIEWVAKRYRKKYCSGRNLQIAKTQARARKQKLAAIQTRRIAKAERDLAAYRARQDAKERSTRQRRIAAANKAKQRRLTATKTVTSPSSASVSETTRTAQRRRQNGTRAKQLAANAIIQGKQVGNNRLAALGAANLSAFRPARIVAPRPQRALRCRVMTASYGGKKTLLIKARAAQWVTYTALSVQDGFETSMAKSYMESYAKGGRTIAQYSTPTQALQKAFSLCPK